MRLILGNLAIDVFAESGEEMPGGPPYFIAQELLRSGLPDVRIVSRLGSDGQQERFPGIRGARLYPRPAPVTTKVIINKDSDGNEIGRLASYAGTLGIADLPQDVREADIIYVSTVLTDVDASALEAFRGRHVVLDLQGYIRENAENGWRRRKWIDAKEYLRNVTILKFSDYERGFLPYSVEEIMERFGVEVILETCGARGATMYHKGRRYSVKAYAKDVLTSVGAGDSFLTAFAEKYWESGDARLSLAYASCRVAQFLNEKNTPSVRRIMDDIAEERL